MIITTLHETAFEYARAIHASTMEARLWPVSDASQTCREYSLSVDPLCALSEFNDYHGNLAMSFNNLAPHKTLVLTSRSVVETHRDPFQANPLDDAYLERKTRLDYLGFDGPVQRVEELKSWIAQCGLIEADRDALWFEQNGLFMSVQRLMNLIYTSFSYDTQATHVATSTREAMEGKRGVCQDFAHVFIAACRMAGIPARYVSGYLVTRRSRSAQGSPASHGWAEAFVPRHGWAAFDPTNDILPDDNYIKIASGCDYRECAPTRGIYGGDNVSAKMHVRVHTIIAEEAARNLDERAASSGDGAERATPLFDRDLVG